MRYSPRSRVPEARSYGCPQPSILFRPEPQLSKGVVRGSDPLDVNDPFPARESPGDDRHPDVLPAGSIEVNGTFSDPEGDPLRVRRGRCRIRLRDQSPPVEPLRLHRHDDVGVDTVIGNIDGCALGGLGPAPVHRDQRSDQRRREIKCRQRQHRRQNSPNPLARFAFSPPARHPAALPPCLVG